jgi:hypothetical protein
MRTVLSALSACIMFVLILGWTVPVSAQSLADVARREAERRKTVKPSSDGGKVLTNKDVPLVPSSMPVAPAATAASSDAAATDVPDPTKAADATKAADPSKTADANKKDAAPRDQKYWGERMTALQAQLEHDQAFTDALQSRVNALTTDFANRDDPAQRAAIAAERQKAVDEIGRLKTSILSTKTAIADLEEEARRSGVPPGWLR